MSRALEVRDSAARGGGDALDHLRRGFHRRARRVAIVILRERPVRGVERRVNHREGVLRRRGRGDERALRHPRQSAVRLSAHDLVHVIRHLAHLIQKLADVALERRGTVVRVRRHGATRRSLFLDHAREDGVVGRAAATPGVLAVRVEVLL